MPTKEQQEDAFQAVQALAGLAKSRTPGGRTVSCKAKIFAGRALTHLAEGEMLVVVADREGLVIKKLERAQRQPAAANVALRFAEIDAAVSWALDDNRLPSNDTSAPALSRAEEQALERGGFSVAPMGPDEASPTLRGVVDYARLLDDSYTTEEAAKQLGVNPSRVRQRLASRELYGIKDRRGWRVPKFQFLRERLVPHIDEILPRLPADLHPVAVYRWFTLPNSDLEMPRGRSEELAEADRAPLTPLEWLSGGFAPEVVAELAANL